MLRREFIQQTGTVAAGALLSEILFALATAFAKKRVAMVGIGHSGTGMWGTEVLREHSDRMEL
jgi:hypothetical protein